MGSALDRLAVWTYESDGEMVAMGQWGVTDEERAASGRQTLAELSRQVEEENRRRAAEWYDKGGLPDGAEMVRVWRSRDPAELRGRVSPAEPLVGWAEDDVLHILWYGAADRVRLVGGVQPRMRRVPGTRDLWEASLRIRDLDRAVITLRVMPEPDPAGSPIGVPHSKEVVWRGPAAPAPLEAVARLGGTLSEYMLESAYLGAPRGVTVYRPPGEDGPLPVCCVGDGQAVQEMARTAETAIAEGIMPPMLLIGIHSALYDGSMWPDLRTREYVRREDPERFDIHMRFVVEDVIPWAHGNEAAAPGPWTVAGYSSSAVWALSAAQRHPDVFDAVVALSPGILPGEGLPDPRVRHYLAAGSLEDGFRGTTRQYADRLREAGLPCHHEEWIGGHDFYWWRERLPRGLGRLHKG